MKFLGSMPNDGLLRRNELQCICRNSRIIYRCRFLYDCSCFLLTRPYAVLIADASNDNSNNDSKDDSADLRPPAHDHLDAFHIADVGDKSSRFDTCNSSRQTEGEQEREHDKDNAVVERSLAGRDRRLLADSNDLACNCRRSVCCCACCRGAKFNI